MDKKFKHGDRVYHKNLKQYGFFIGFCMSMTDPNGTFVRLSEINEMISDGILTVDFDKLEQRIFDKTVIKCG